MVGIATFSLAVGSIPAKERSDGMALKYVVKSRKSFWTGSTTKYVAIEGLQEGQVLTENEAMILAMYDINDTLAGIAETVEEIQKAQ